MGGQKKKNFGGGGKRPKGWGDLCQTTKKNLGKGSDKKRVRYFGLDAELTHTGGGKHSDSREKTRNLPPTDNKMDHKKIYMA